MRVAGSTPGLPGRDLGHGPHRHGQARAPGAEAARVPPRPGREHKQNRPGKALEPGREGVRPGHPDADQLRRAGRHYHRHHRRPAT